MCALQKKDERPAATAALQGKKCWFVRCSAYIKDILPQALNM